MNINKGKHFNKALVALGVVALLAGCTSTTHLITHSISNSVSATDNQSSENLFTKALALFHNIVVTTVIY